MSIHLGRHFTGLDSFSEYTPVPPTAPQATGRLTSDQAPDAEGWAGCVCWPCPEQHHPHTLKLCLTCAGAFNCSPDHPYQVLSVSVSGSLSPFHPTPLSFSFIPGSEIGAEGTRSMRWGTWMLPECGVGTASCYAGGGEAAPWGFPNPFPAQQGATGLSHTLSAACPVT